MPRSSRFSPRLPQLDRRVRRAVAVLLVAVCFAASASAVPPQFAPWMNGVRSDEQALQIQAIDTDSYVIRESFTESANAPFVYLLFGAEQALLLDTGEGQWPIREAVDYLISDWLARNDRESITLIVAHSHSHSDHHGADSAFASRPHTTVVGLHPEEVAKFFGVAHWPEDTVTYDLGGRPLDVIPTPGHEAAHIAIYDRRTKTLLSGDSILPAHVLIPLDEFATFRASIGRLAAFARQHDVETVLGAHVEMSAQPGKDFELGATSHPNEHALPLKVGALFELESSLKAMGDSPEMQMHDDFAIVPLPHEVLAPYELHD